MCILLVSSNEPDFTHQSQHQTREKSGQAEDDIRAPNGNPQLLCQVVMTTLQYREKQQQVLLSGGYAETGRLQNIQPVCCCWIL